MRMFLYGIFILLLSGCASSQNTQMLNRMSTKIEQLERQTEIKDDEIQRLQQEVQDLSRDADQLSAQLRSNVTYGGQAVSSAPTTAKSAEIVRVSGVSGESVQTALKKAGYYRGAVDGKIGNKTQAAITKFQQDNRLKADGKVGPMTWSKLKVYLE